MRKPVAELRLLLICVLLMSLSSCKNNPIEPLLKSMPLQFIKGRVDKWAMGDSMTVVACVRYTDVSGKEAEYVCGSGRVNNDGSFAFNLSAPPVQALTARAIEAGNPDSVKFATVYFLEIRSPNRPDASARLMNATFDITSDSIAYHDGEYFTYFEYAERDANMIGTVAWPLTDGGELKMIYDLHYQKGWNRVVVKNISRTSIQFSVSNVNDANWYLVSDRYLERTISGLKVGWMPPGAAK